ncbi:nucleotidyltransferase family protein [uncultured Ruminococcus sp.]|uniref:tRNA(Met) cytidine acetate ligase n=1 Tax=uncultured Ruminococcus sp. TaxID=165186 RepID=UPI00292CF451|nr:nucleotidyltransferase family protein [uncultured Ruminococcus sp.]
MSRAAVICEFNPFHNGHKFLLEKIKAAYADEIVCIMSGNFVQRGDIAITDKYTRAKAALQNGADIVVELPTVYAMAGAQTFAENGVRIAAAMNCDRLYFGAENSINDLIEVVELLENERINEKIHAAMKSGEYYPKALSMAVGAHYAEIINQPNNILALEYIKACKKHGVAPTAIPRKNVNHDEDIIRDGIASASKIRELIKNGEPYQLLTPMEIPHACTIKSIEPAILYRLKTISAEELRQIADVSEGLEYRIIEAAKQYNSLSEIYDAVKTKRYTMARIRRIILSVFLNITVELQSTPVPYLRILGIKSGWEEVLRGAKLPLIVKVKADYEHLNQISAKEIFYADLRAAEAMNIAKEGDPINEFTQGVIKV